ncbi:MAG: PQQ-dependent sugar dehydrogenase [Burkholderiaceae bacterium]|nr:PQQ-dependent sugar dehydrogenase [Burkholderiaceae bacterium]
MSIALRLPRAHWLLALAAGSALAQAPQPAGVPATPPPPAWAQGRPAEMAQSTLAPLPGRNTATPPGEIPLDKIRVPAGFQVELWAHGLPGARAMVRGEQGKIYVGTRGIGRVYEVSDRGSERSVRTVVDKLNQPAGVAFRDGALTVMAIDRVLRFAGIESQPDVAPQDLTAAFQLPPLQHHNWKYIRFGPDGKLYVPFGAPCNICQPGAEYAQIRRYNADGSGMEVIARGVRNSVGFDFHPQTRELWFSDHGRDWMGDDGPEDELNRLPAGAGAAPNFGFPFCHADGVPDRDLRADKPCDGVTRPVTTLGPHAAAMGVMFYTGSQFPAEYRQQLLVVRKGSWNRTQKSGYDVLRVQVDGNGRHIATTPFMTGFADLQANSFWGRPAYLLQLPDGSVLVSDEQMGAIYRVSHRGS